MKIICVSLILLVLCVAFCSDSVPSVSYVIASASAWSSNNSVHLSASGSADEIEVGGYTLSVTGKSNLSSRFVGSTSPYHSNTLNPKRRGESESSIGGRGYDGVNHQEYDDAEAE